MSQELPVRSMFSSDLTSNEGGPWYSPILQQSLNLRGPLDIPIPINYFPFGEVKKSNPLAEVEPEPALVRANP